MWDMITFFSTLLSPLIPYGIHVEYVHSIWYIHGFHMESTWNVNIPYGIHVECTWNMWIPYGIFTFHGIHMESMWNIFIYCHTVNKYLDIIK